MGFLVLSNGGKIEYKQNSLFIYLFMYWQTIGLNTYY
jgi:hypothetical protein